MENELMQNQDINLYFSCNAFAELIYFRSELRTGKMYKRLINELYNREDILTSISTQNLLIMLVNLPKEENQYVQEEITKRINEGEDPFTQSNFEMDFWGMNFTLWQLGFSKLSEENRNKIAEKMKGRVKGFEDSVFFKVMRNCTSLFNYNFFIALYEDGKISEEALPFMQELAESRKEAFNTVDFAMFQREFLGLDKKAFFYIIRYPNICKRLVILKDNNPELLKIFIKEINDAIKNNEHISTVYTEIDSLSRNFALYSSYFARINKSDAVRYGLIQYENFREFLKQQDSGKSCNLEEFLDNKYELIYANISDNKALEGRKEIIFNRYFSISFQEAERIVKQYAIELNELQGLISEKDFDVILQMKQIVECTSAEELDEKYKILKTVYDSKSIIKLESSLREAYAKTYILKFEDTRIQIQEQLNNSETSYTEYNGKKIPIIKLSGEEHLLIHSSDTGFKGSKQLKDGSFRKTWEEKEDQSKHLIATIHVDSSFHGVAPINENGVYLVFLPKESETLNLMGNTDINSHVRSPGFYSGSAKYLVADNMSKTARRVYQEFAIEECMPDAIAIYDDMPDEYIENAYKAAQEFDVPVILYSKEEIVRRQKEKLESLLQKFEKSMELVTLEEIISLYETNRAGWLLNRQDENDETLTQNIDNSKYMGIFEELGKRIRASIEIFMKKASHNEIVSLYEYIDKERSLYREQNESTVNFAKVKMSDFLDITAEDCEKMIKKYGITSQDINATEADLTKIEENDPTRREDGVK